MTPIRGAKGIADLKGKPPAAAPHGPAVSIGPGIGFVGSIEGADTLHIETTVDLNVTCRVLVIMDSGRLSGTAEADVVEVRGRFEGDLTARDRLIVHDHGAVSGTIRYRQIEAARGAELQGSFERIAA